MSEPQRYTPAYVYSNPYSDEHVPGMEEDAGGDYVSYDDYAALREQLQAVTQELKKWKEAASDDVAMLRHHANAGDS